MTFSPCPRCRAVGRDNRGDNLANYPDGSSHCFSCQFHIFPKHYVPRRVETNVAKALLPRDFTREVPANALKWLLQYGLPWSYWKETIGYSPSEERLVFLVGNGPRFSIGRYVGTETGHKKWYVWGDSHRHAEVVSPRNDPRTSESHSSGMVGEGNLAISTTVLVEDLLSAHKIAAAGYTAIPLFGTQIHKPHLYYLMQQPEGSITVLWLDKDQQGTIARKALGLQALLGQCVKTVSTDKDPKELTIKEINENLRM